MKRETAYLSDDEDIADESLGDGSAYPSFFLTEEEADYDQDNMDEGWGETCTGYVDSYIGSRTYNEAIENSEEQKLEKNEK